MADERNGRTEYNWSYRGDDASDYRARYTQGFDPNYIRRMTGEEDTPEEEALRRPAAAGRRRPAGRRARLYAQQEIRTARDTEDAAQAGYDTAHAAQTEAPENDGRTSVADEDGKRQRASAAKGYGRKRKTIVSDRTQRKRKKSSSGDGRRVRRASAADTASKKNAGSTRRRRVLQVRYTVLAIIAAAAVFALLLGFNTYSLTITVAGTDPLYLEKGETYTDPGATAVYQGSLLHFGDAEVPVIAEQEIDTNTCGTYQVVYRAEYKEQQATATRTVIVPDRTAPVITLDETVNVVKKGEEWKDSFTATDDQDGDLTDQVEISGEVNMRRDGRYELTYRVQDAAGNEATASRWVTVSSVAINRPETARQGDKNVIYLTFDDGPGMYTDRVLDILDSHNVKATFFVTDANPANRDLIGEEYRRGHTVGLHSLTHDYDIIYEDGAAFWNDMDQEMAIIREQTGADTPFMRFPGGSSNERIAASSELQTALASGAKERGLVYYDWTIDSYDSNDALTEDDIYWNLVDQLSVVNTKVILCHDLKRTMVDALDEFLSWAIENHYVFLPITEESPVVHHVDLG